ncbi:MAG: hypothetical protein ACLFRV_12880 [Acidimicrobiales bacterium]
MVRSVAAVAALMLLLAACGDDDGAGRPTILDDDDQALVQQELDRYGTELLNEHQEVGVGGMSYSSHDGHVTGFLNGDIFTAVEKCDQYADMLGELEGPPGTVPVQIIRYIDDGADFEVLAKGAAGDRCQEA